jgi:hypothetical protein
MIAIALAAYLAPVAAAALVDRREAAIAAAPLETACAPAADMVQKYPPPPDVAKATGNQDGSMPTPPPPIDLSKIPPPRNIKVVPC